MISLNQVEDQLKRVGCNFRFWGRPEIRELAQILMPGEEIAQAVNGRYEGGFAMLVVTNHRLLLVDRKPMFLTLEDIRFDMIAEMDYTIQVIDATVHIMTPNRKLSFNTWSQKRLRKLFEYTQKRVMEIRQHYMLQQLQVAQGEREETAGFVGGLIMQGSAGSREIPMNPYSHVPLLSRRTRRFGKA